MSDRSIVVGLRWVVAVGSLLAIAGSIVSIALDGAGYWWDSYSLLGAMVAVFFGAFVWVVIEREPRNLAVWTMAASAFCGVYVAGAALAPLLTDAAPASLLYPLYLPAEQHLDVALLLMVTAPAVDVGIFIPLTFGLLLFPNGSLPSRRWRAVVVFAAVAVTSATLLEVWSYRPSNGSPPEDDVAWNVAFLTVFLAAAAGVVALVGRFRASTGETRQQFKWVMWGAAVSVPVVVIAILGYEVLLTEDQSAALVTAAVGLLIICYGIAVARYRLYDVDLVISRSIVYGSLASFITGIYVVVVVGVGRAFGDSDQPNAALAIAATALVAVAFQPVRRRLQRMADRLVYGRKATPHDVLSEFSRRVAANDDALLGLVVRSLVEGTGAERASLWITVDGRLSKTSAWPEGLDGPPGDVVSLPIRQNGAELGALRLSAPAGQRLSPQDEQLAGQVAAGLGLALRNRVLTETLQSRVDELRRSRQRLVALQDETRRRLERNLHDGAQQHLVALKVKLGLARTVAGKAGATDTADALDRLVGAADVTVEAVRDFARGVHSPLLEAEGLGPAVAAEARRAPLPVTVRADGIGRYDREVETTVNRCVVEALQNVSEHAGATAARIVLAQENGSVSFEVSDDGEGFDPTSTDRGDGLATMGDRLDAMAGTLTVRSAPGKGTTVAGEIPFDAQVRG
jgi:signal transduction histidine kinase